MDFVVHRRIHIVGLLKPSDNQLPAALARFLCSLGADCQHVLELGLGQASDSEIWRYSAAHQLVLMSKDEDFFHRAMAPGATVQLVWVRLGNCLISNSFR